MPRALSFPKVLSTLEKLFFKQPVSILKTFLSFFLLPTSEVRPMHAASSASEHPAMVPPLSLLCALAMISSLTLITDGLIKTAKVVLIGMWD